MLMFLLSLLLMIAAPIIHIILCSLRVAGRTRLTVIATTLICLIAGTILPVLASYIDIINLPPGTKCATPSVGFAFLGFAITGTVIPLTAIIFSIIIHYKNKRLHMPY
jgi:hypothetical protein